MKNSSRNPNTWPSRTIVTIHHGTSWVTGNVSPNWLVAQRPFSVLLSWGRFEDIPLLMLFRTDNRAEAHLSGNFEVENSLLGNVVLHSPEQKLEREPKSLYEIGAEPRKNRNAAIIIWIRATRRSRSEVPRTVLNWSRFEGVKNRIEHVAPLSKTRIPTKNGTTVKTELDCANVKDGYWV